MRACSLLDVRVGGFGQPGHRRTRHRANRIDAVATEIPISDWLRAFSRLRLRFSITGSGFHGECPDGVANRQPLVGAVSYSEDQRIWGRGVGYTPSLWVEPGDD